MPDLKHIERELIRLVSEGDECAFTKLFHQWQGFLYTHIHRITENSALTEEIVQDVFTKIWMTRETLATIDNFKVYLIVVSRNQALNALKKMLKEISAQKVYERSYQEESDPQEETGRYSLIDEAIDQLSHRQKEVYLLHRHQRKTYAEIAQQLGIGKDTVKEYLQVATQSITKYVKGRLVVMILLFVFER